MKNKEHLKTELKNLLLQLQVASTLLKLVNSNEEYNSIRKEMEEIARRCSLIQYEIENGSKLISIRICSLKNVISTSKTTKCYKCKSICYYDSELVLKKSKNCKNICDKCVLKIKNLPKGQKEILEKIK